MRKRMHHPRGRGDRDERFYESMPAAARTGGYDRAEQSEHHSGRKWLYWLLGAALVLLGLLFLAGFDLDLRGGGADVNVDLPRVETPETNVPAPVTP
ncbi:MAG TPA: hypothetical protein VK963_04610 [Candidatus Saccharimonadales bacterium]|nr:hypothetical protein [Candidatus Saccharimonadales bacterium]